jgi:hypothetical protein
VIEQDERNQYIDKRLRSFDLGCQPGQLACAGNQFSHGGNGDSPVTIEDCTTAGSTAMLVTASAATTRPVANRPSLTSKRTSRRRSSSKMVFRPWCRSTPLAVPTLTYVLVMRPSASGTTSRTTCR